MNIYFISLGFLRSNIYDGQTMFILLFLLISFGSVCAVLFTPALPQITAFFGVTPSAAQLTITLYLIGYAFGQLLYGPLANGYGRKKALYIGISLEIISALVCVFSGSIHAFWLLVLARLFMALGASVGLKISFTIVSDYYSQEASTKIISHLMMAFAVMPGLGVALGGFLSEHFNWQMCFYFLALYGIFLLGWVYKIPETAKYIDKDALKFSNILSKYSGLLNNGSLIAGAALLGGSGSFIYLFAAIAPFLTANFMHLSPVQYGLWNLLPPLGIIIGSQLSAYCANRLQPATAIYVGIVFAVIGTGMMLGAFLLRFVIPGFLFFPLILIYVGLAFIFSNSSSLAMAAVEDKSSGSAMMNFISVGIQMLSVVGVGLFSISSVLLLPVVYSILTILLFFVMAFSRSLKVCGND